MIKQTLGAPPFQPLLTQKGLDLRRVEGAKQVNLFHLIRDQELHVSGEHGLAPDQRQ